MILDFWNGSLSTERMHISTKTETRLAPLKSASRPPDGGQAYALLTMPLRLERHGRAISDY